MNNCTLFIIHICWKPESSIKPWINSLTSSIGIPSTEGALTTIV